MDKQGLGAGHLKHDCSISAMDDWVGVVESTCLRGCLDRDCGPDGCGGECGTCTPGSTCDAALCVVVSPCDRSDRFGMVLVRGAGEATIDFGKSQRPRSRSYRFEPGAPGTHRAMVQALSEADTNIRLTALLDLRREPVPEAREVLEALLDDETLAIWLNAATTLSLYDGIERVVAERVERLRRGEDPARQIVILGGLRHPAAVPALVERLSSPDAELRARAAWALGFIGAATAIEELERLTGDASAEVRAEAALAIGRIGGYGSIPVLEGLASDDSAAVAFRAQEAVNLSTF